MKMGWWSIMRRCAAGCWRSTSGLGERITAKRRERKEHFGELVQLDG